MIDEIGFKILPLHLYIYLTLSAVTVAREWKILAQKETINSTINNLGNGRRIMLSYEITLPNRIFFICCFGGKHSGL